MCFGLSTVLETFVDFHRTHNEPLKAWLILFSQIFGIIDISSNYVLFWVFVIKYWSIAIKLQLINERSDQDRLNKFFTAILVISIFLSFVEITLVFYWFPNILLGGNINHAV